MAIAQKHGESSSSSRTSSVASYAGARRSCGFFFGKRHGVRRRLRVERSAGHGRRSGSLARQNIPGTPAAPKNLRTAGLPPPVCPVSLVIRTRRPNCDSRARSCPCLGPEPISRALAAFFAGATRVAGAAAAAASRCAAPPLSPLAPSLFPAVRLKEPTGTRRRGHRSLLQRPFSLSFSHLSPSPPCPPRTVRLFGQRPRPRKKSSTPTVYRP